MSRPWYTYPLLVVGGIALLLAIFRPMAGGTSAEPGGWLDAAGRLSVRPESPLARADLRTGDRFLRADRIYAAPPAPAGDRWLRWARGVPDPAPVEVRRGTERLSREVRPDAPAPVVRIAWWLLGLLNTALVALGLALLWQRPREAPAILLGLMLLSAPVFAFPGKQRLLFVVLAAHFFSIFPEPVAAGPQRRGFWRAAALYLPFLVLGFLGFAAWGGGQVEEGARLLDLLSVGYALFGLGILFSRRRRSTPEHAPVFQALVMMSGAITAVALMDLAGPVWFIHGQFVPANAPAAILFSAAVWRLVFRLKVLEVRVITRRSLQYLLARWTLGTLFLIPGFFLVFRFGQLSVTHERIRPAEVLFNLALMIVAALLLGKRRSVLRNLDRRFFRDPDTARQALVRLAQELGRQTEAVAVLATLESGVRQAVRPRSLRYTLPDIAPDGEAELSVPIHRGERVLGYLQLGPKESEEPYSAEEGELLEAAAVQAALALENTRLSAALLARQRAELTARTAGVLAGAEEERRRLAADLHDQVLPELRQIASDVDRLKLHSNGLAPELERLESEVRGTMDSVREVMEALRPSALDMLGLGDALESYLRNGAARCQPPLAISVRRVGEEPELPPDRSLALYRICQEAMNNLLKHSGADRAGLEIRHEEGRLRLVIWDNGRGLDLARSLGKGHGLANIRYRADLAGAEVHWDSPEEGGTRVRVELPVRHG